MKIKIYSGLNEVGGNIITLGDNEEFILDFGISFNKLNNFLNPTIQYFNLTYNNRTIFFFKRLGLIPENFDGIFFDDKIINERKCVLITHAHSDHSRFVKYLNPLINVFISEDTRKYFEVIDLFNYENYTNGKLLNDIINFDNYKLLSIEKVKRNINIIEYNKVYNIHGYSITPVFLDHSYENTGFIITDTNNKKTIFYTGDYMLNDVSKKNIIAISKKYKIDCLISEITYPDIYVDKHKTMEEKFLEVKDEINKDKPIFIALYPRYYKRIIEFIKIFNKHYKKKKYYINPPNAYTIMLFNKLNDIHFDIISNYTEKLVNGKKELVGKYRIVEYSDIDENSIVFISPSELINLFYIDKNKIEGGTIILSTASPFDIVQEIKEEYIKNIADENNLKLIRIHKSSHINLNDLEEIVDILKPKSLVPVHTINRDEVIRKFENIAIKENEINI